jgi:voltage-gated sodium channel
VDFDDDPIEEEVDAPPKKWIHTTKADMLFGGIIFLNAIVMGIETDARTQDNDKHVSWLLIDSFFNVVFICEMCLRIQAEKNKWVKDMWNVFDAVLVFVGVVDSWILAFVSGANLKIVTLLRLFRLLKLLRIMRLLRLVSFLTELRLLLLGTLQALKTTVWGFVLLVGVIYISALFVTQVVGKQCCGENMTFSSEIIPDFFGTLVRSAFTLFMFTMEFQPDIARDTWGDGPYVTCFLVIYTVFTNLMLLNMVSSVIVECILSLSNAEAEREKASQDDSKKHEYVKELVQIFNDIDTDDSGLLTWEEFTGITKDSLGGGLKMKMKPGLRRALKIAGVTPNQAAELFHILDADATGTISKEEFIRGFLRVKAPPESKHILRVECRVDTVVKKMDQVQSALVGIARSLAMLTQDAGTGALGHEHGGWGGTFSPESSYKWADTGGPVGPIAEAAVVRLDVPLLTECDYEAVVGNEDGGAAGYLYPKANGLGAAVGELPPLSHSQPRSDAPAVWSPGGSRTASQVDAGLRLEGTPAGGACASTAFTTPQVRAAGSSAGTPLASVA